MVFSSHCHFDLELIEKRAEVVKELKQLEEKSERVIKLFQDEEFLEKAQTTRFADSCPFVNNFNGVDSKRWINYWITLSITLSIYA